MRDDALLAQEIAKIEGDALVVVLGRIVEPLAIPFIPYSKRSVFRKYVFFSPALFMGIFSMIILSIVAFIGVQILFGLQSPTRFDTVKRK